MSYGYGIGRCGYDDVGAFYKEGIRPYGESTKSVLLNIQKDLSVYTRGATVPESRLIIPKELLT